PLRSDAETLEEIYLDPPSLKLARQRLDDLVADERRAVDATRRRGRWKRTEWAMTVIGFGVSGALALLNPLAGLGAASSVVGFAGWAAGMKAEAPESGRPLNGASMFLAAEKRLGLASR